MDAKKLGQQPINAIGPDGTFGFGNAGLTKRELFAAMAMQGIWANSDEAMAKAWSIKDIARNAVEAADALLAELAKEGE